ncbi:MAG TPA: hypothetical protein VFS76_18860 [Pyrinomonadaceae bacterium]|nr:hypothetical protein [Pyrinomonadaceae bacterium]
METHQDQFLINAVPNRIYLNKRLEESSWGFFLLMTGTLMLLPREFVPEGAWLIGAGLILLGLNGIRHLNDIKVSRFTITLGFAAIGLGLATLLGLRLPLLAMFLSLVGLSIIVRSILPTDKVDRKQNG